MAFGTPTDGGAAYGTTSVSPAYPSGITANDALVLIVGQKPSTANGGTVTTPSGWTLREELTGAGGYGTTLGADTGNTNLRIYTKDTVTGSETGNLAVTLGTSNVGWGLIVRVPANGGTFSYGTADGSRTTAPTSGTAFTTTLTNGASAPNFEADDIAIWAMCIPTDVLNNGFTAPTISASGATFANATELEEPDSGTGNDIGGYVAYADCTAGSSTAAPTVGVTATGTVTNIRGPIALLRIREALPERTGSLSATETGSDTFSASGNVIVEGSLAVSETGDDTFSASGTVMDMTATGSLAATETGNDTFSSSGTVLVEGSLVATEAENDSFSSSGTVLVEGSLSVSETGDDTFSASGTVDSNTVTGSLSATETGSDTFASTGTVLVEGSFAATESANDSFSASGSVLVSGTLSVTELPDELGSYVVDDYVDEGYTKNGWEGLVLVQGGLSVSEVGSDTFSSSGSEEEPPKSVGGRSLIKMSASRRDLNSAAQKMLRLLDKPVVKNTAKIVKVTKKLEEVAEQTKPRESTLESLAEQAIVELRNQQRVVKNLQDAKKIRVIIEDLKEIKKKIDDEEEALMLLFG